MWKKFRSFIDFTYKFSSSHLEVFFFTFMATIHRTDDPPKFGTGQVREDMQDNKKIVILLLFGDLQE